MTKEELKQRTKQFALDVFKFLMKIEKSKAVDVVSYQLFKSSSSVAANYRAVCRGKSSADFLNKLKIVDEEADELGTDLPTENVDSDRPEFSDQEQTGDNAFTNIGDPEVLKKIEDEEAAQNDAEENENSDEEPEE